MVQDGEKHYPDFIAPNLLTAPLAFVTLLWAHRRWGSPVFAYVPFVFDLNVAP